LLLDYGIQGATIEQISLVFARQGNFVICATKERRSSFEVKNLETFKKYWAFTWFRIVFAVALILFLGLFYYAISVPVKIGSKTVCRYGHVIKDDTRTVRLPWFLADIFEAKTTKTVCAKHEKCEKLYADAQRKIADGELEEAKTTLNEVQELDEGFKQTSSQLKAIEQAGSSSGSSSGSSGSSSNNSGSANPGGNTPPTIPIDLPALLPQGNISGYTRGTLVTDENTAQVDYLPDANTRQKINSLLITVRKMKDKTAANNFINNVSKKVYPNDQESPTIKGKTAYFGTNIHGLATLSWADGILVYEIIMRSTTFEPAKLYDDIIDITDYFP